MHSKYKKQSYSNLEVIALLFFNLLSFSLIVGRPVRLRVCAIGRKRCREPVSFDYLRGISGQGNMDPWLQGIRIPWLLWENVPVCVGGGPG